MNARFSIPIVSAFAALLLASAAKPAQAQTSGSVQVDGATIAYRVQGHGPALMLIHGYPLSGELFAKNRVALSRRFTVVTPDLRGFGDSTTPDANGSVGIYAKDMLGVMDHLHIRKAIIGGIIKKGSVKAAIGSGETLATRSDSRPTLAHINVPVLLLVGADDPLYAVEMQKMMKASAYGSKLAIIPGAAHAAIIEKSEACDQAILGWANTLR